MTEAPDATVAGVKPVAYAIESYFKDRRSEFERDGTVVFHSPMGMATFRLYSQADLDAKDGCIAELKRQLEFVGTSDQWRKRESETQESLQKIGEEFGLLGGEPRVTGLHRVLAEQRVALAALKAELATEQELREKAERERDEALSRAEELEGYQEQIATEFEKDCWKALRSLLDECKFDWQDAVDGEGVSAEDAREYISTTIDEIERGETRALERAGKAEERVFRAELERDAANERAEKAKDEGVNFVFDQLALALGLSFWTAEDGSETWDGDVCATLMRILRDSRTIDPETDTLACDDLEAARELADGLEKYGDAEHARAEALQAQNDEAEEWAKARQAFIAEPSGSPNGRLLLDRLSNAEDRLARTILAKIKGQSDAE